MPKSHSQTRATDIEEKERQVVGVPLEMFALTAPLDEVVLTGDLTGAFYVDDLRLVAGDLPETPTAVLEEHTDARPRSFTLAQNCPNPFNASTVIRFTLPTDNLPVPRPPPAGD